MDDIMYLQQALKQPNVKEFVQAVIKEVNGHVDSNNRTLQKWSIPEDIQIVPSVWSLQRKCNLTTNKVKSHKARLNLHGGKQVYGMNNFETCAPVVTWFAIRLMIIFGIIFCWALWQVDFVMAQRTCFEAREEHLRPETGWVHVEFIPCGQTHVHRTYNIINRWLHFLPWWHHFHGVLLRWYLPRQQRLATSRSHQGDPEPSPPHWRPTPPSRLCRCQHQEKWVHPTSVNWFYHWWRCT